MAQSVEHVIGNDEVISSILISSSRAVGNAHRFFYISNTSSTAPDLHRHTPRSERYRDKLLALSSSPNSAQKEEGELFSSGVKKR